MLADRERTTGQTVLGGIGKTSPAKRLAWRRLQDYDDWIFFVDLVAAATASEVPCWCVDFRSGYLSSDLIKVVIVSQIQRMTDALWDDCQGAVR